MASQADILQSCLQMAAKAAKPALAHCIDEAVTALQAAEDKAIKIAERDELSGAWRLLSDSKAAWLADWEGALQVAFSRSAMPSDADRASGRKQLTASFSPSSIAALESLSLVNDSDVTQAIESSRLLQQILPRLEQSLAGLDALISSAQSMDNVRPDLNPLRPEVFTVTLQVLLAASAADSNMSALWIRHLADPLSRQLLKIYEKAIAELELANVRAANYRVLQATSGTARKSGGHSGDENLAPGKARPGGKGGSGGSGGNGSGGNGSGDGSAEGKHAPQYADLSNYEIRDELFQDFLFHGGGNAHHGLAPSYYATVEEELTALKAAPDSGSATLHDPRDDAGYRAVPAVDRPNRRVDVSSPLSPQVWGAYGRSRERAIVRTQLKKEATKVGQVLGLEVVRKLVNQVAQDPRLLVPVREAIVALEPSLLRLAMVDPRFFSDEGHPGRRLMERVAQRSFKYNDEYSSEFAGFFEAVTGTFNELNALAIENARPFGMVLATLEHHWDEQDQIESSAKQKVLKALHFAEDRQASADQIAFDLSSRSDLDNVPGVVMDFLFGPWALAMAHARLADQRNQVDPEGFGSVVPDLLWSVKRDVTLKQPSKLIEMIPGLLDKLHHGLDMLGQAPKENEKFFESLMKLHQPVLKLRRLKSRRDAEESGSVPLEELERPATAEQRRTKAAELPWLGREDLGAAGFEDTQPTEPSALEVEEPMTAGVTVIEDSAPAPLAGFAQDTSAEAMQVGDSSASAAHPPHYTPSEAEAILFGLRTGGWVDLYSKRRWLRAQLIWASTKATLFMFLSHGGQPHSMTKRSCEKLIMQRFLRPVDTHGVVGQALDAVASEVAAKTNAQAADNVPSPLAANHYDEAETV
jgi:hypothetical protein